MAILFAAGRSIVMVMRPVLVTVGLAIIRGLIQDLIYGLLNGDYNNKSPKEIAGNLLRRIRKGATQRAKHGVAKGIGREVVTIVKRSIMR